MLTTIVALLPQLLPIALFFINLFTKDQAQRDANKQAFLDAISAHHDDAVASAVERRNVWQQDQEMREKFAKEAAQGKPNAP